MWFGQKSSARASTALGFAMGKTSVTKDPLKPKNHRKMEVQFGRWRFMTRSIMRSFSVEHQQSSSKSWPGADSTRGCSICFAWQHHLLSIDAVDLHACYISPHLDTTCSTHASMTAVTAQTSREKLRWITIIGFRSAQKHYDHHYMHTVYITLG